MTVKHSGNAFELVATVCGSDSQYKLVNLATRLQGQAYPIYRTCTVQQFSASDGMSQRFITVRIQSVQSG